jgi:hypothetical protein
MLLPGARLEVAWDSTPGIRPSDAYLSIPTTTSGVSTPDHASLDITGDIEVRVCAHSADWTDGFQILASKWAETSDERSWILYVQAQGFFEFHWTTDGTLGTWENFSSDFSVADVTDRPITFRVTLDVDDGDGNKVVSLWAYDGDTVEDAWLIGSTEWVDPGTTSIYSSTAVVAVATANDDYLASSGWVGNVYSFALLDELGATVASLDDDMTVGATAYTDPQGLVWTAAGDAIVETDWQVVAGDGGDSGFLLDENGDPILDEDENPIELEGFAALGLESVSVRRGVTPKTGEIEPSEMSVTVADPFGWLDPTNTDSPFYPAVKLRTRVRVIVEPDGDDERTVLTGFMSKLTPHESVGARTVDIDIDDLLTVIAGAKFRDSAYDAYLLDELGDDLYGYWPLAESTGKTVRDLNEGRDGAYLHRAVPANATVAYDARPVQTFGWTGQALRQRADLPVYPEQADWSFTLAFDIALPVVTPSFDEETDAVLLELWNLGGTSVAPTVAPSGNNGKVSLWAQWSGDASRALRFKMAWGGTTSRSLLMNTALDVFDDGLTHHVVVRIPVTADRSTASIWIDGVDRTESVTLVSDASITGPFAGVPTISGKPWEYDEGTDTWVPYTSSVEAVVARHAYWFTALTDAQVAALAAVRLAPWDGEETGSRVARVCYLAGIDPGDVMDGIAEAGTIECGPADLSDRDPFDLINELAQTEAGATFVDGDGILQFRARPAATPTPLVTYGNVDGTVLHERLSPDMSLARLVNVAVVGWSDGDPQRVEHPASIAQYGEVSVSLSTVAASAGAARQLGQRIVQRNHEPREQIDELSVLAGLSSATVEAVLDVEPGDSVARNDAGVTSTLIVQRVEIAWAEGSSLRSTFGLRDLQTFLTSQFDIAGRGYDLTVVGA